MHKLSIAALLCATLALPGCIFAIGSDREDWDDGIQSSDCCENCQQMMHVQHRLAVLEHHAKGQCTADCALCTPAAAKADAKAETKPAAK